MAHYPPKEETQDAVEAPPSDAPAETPPAKKESGWDFSTTMFGED